ncbi:uncharacterized protein LOC111906194 [Lactuca sativa]|uniref:uncharacterized protein LOC111906194 n=1 Tax=Lactuca sativa TaxID=4236 RepID=UPI0022AE8225|nr:uncharacterized protein LOC111906194 [Lactuca sativa]
MVEKAREREMESDFRTKRKPKQEHIAVGQAKKPKTSDSSSRGQQGCGQCAKCWRFHDGTGHKKGDCPRLQGGGGAVAAPAPATVRINDSQRVDAPAVKRRAFQLTTEEARAAPDVVVGTFLVNGMSVHVLFDSGANRSFVSLMLSKKFRDATGTSDSPLEIEIVYDRTVSTVRVYRDCVLNVLGERFRVDLVSIPLQGLKAIVGMDWLGVNGAMIDCECHLVRVRTPSRVPTLCSGARARRFMQQGYAGFLAYISDTRVETTTDVGSVPFVREFQDIFPE